MAVMIIKRKGFILFLCAFIFLFGRGLHVSAEEIYSEEAGIRIQVRATVPEDFVEPVSIKYEGKNKKDNEIDMILDYEHGYMTMVTVPRDLYTLKHNNTAHGYTADCAAAFTVENAETDHTYWLPVTVNTDNSSGSEKDGLLNLLVRADLETEDHGVSDISVRYSGTHGNLIIADLNAENGYQTVVQIMKDIYTKETVTVSDGFHAIAQYSFDLRRADTENYLLDITVREGGTADEEAEVEEVLLPDETEDLLREIEKEEDEERVLIGDQKIVFEITNHEKAHINGTVYVAYAGEDNVIETELNESNQYSVVLDEPYDVYELLYITCYDDESLIFETSQDVIQADGSEAMIPVRIFVQDGRRGSLKDILIMIAAVLIIAVVIYIYLKKRKRNKKKTAEEYDDFDESLYKDDEIGMDDLGLDLGMDDD